MRSGATSHGALPGISGIHHSRRINNFIFSISAQEILCYLQCWYVSMFLLSYSFFSCYLHLGFLVWRDIARRCGHSTGQGSI